MGLSPTGRERVPGRLVCLPLSEVSSMLHASIPSVAPAASLPLALDTPPASAVLAAAEHLLSHLEQGRPVDAATLRAAMESAFGGAWTSFAPGPRRVTIRSLECSSRISMQLRCAVDLTAPGACLLSPKAQLCT